MELKQIWEEALKIIEEETSPVSFETWIQPIIPCGMEGNQVILQVENTFFKEMLEKRYLSFIRNAIKFVTKNEYDIVLLTEEEQKGARKPLTAAALTYVAALLMSALQLLRYVLIFFGRGGRRGGGRE